MSTGAPANAAVPDALMIGVSGMRGTVGGSLTPGVVHRMAAAFADFLWDRHQPPDRPPRVVLGRDSRPSGPYVRDAAASALEAAGIELIDLGVVTTPGVAMMVAHLAADAGMVATASHNPIQWNGLKFLDARGAAPRRRRSRRSSVATRRTPSGWCPLSGSWRRSRTRRRTRCT